MLNVTVYFVLCAIIVVSIRIVAIKMIPDMRSMYQEYFKNEDRSAISEFKQADQDFNYAEEKYIDIAIYRRKAAEERLQALIREKRVG